VDGVGAADRAGPGLGQADVADLTLGHQLGQGVGGVLDGCTGVDAVLVVQVDVVGSEPGQRPLDCERGLDVTLNDIAHHAGVGVGTAYRRFSNKEEVIDALFEQRLDQVAALATEALEDPDAWRGLTTFLEQSLRLQLEDRGLKEILNNPYLGQDRVNEARDRIAPLINAMVDRAKAQGVLRRDFEGAYLRR